MQPAGDGCTKGAGELTGPVGCPPGSTERVRWAVSPARRARPCLTASCTRWPFQVALKKPEARMLSRLNPVLPFEDATSLEFLSERNDASLIVVGSDSKKRPNNLVFVRVSAG